VTIYDLLLSRPDEMRSLWDGLDFILPKKE